MTTPSIAANPVSATRVNPTVALVISYLLFVALGIPDGFLGAANPAIRAEFGINTGAFGWILLAGTGGYIISTFSLGKVMARFPFTSVLIGAGILRSVVLAGYFFMPAWAGLVALGAMAGFSAGFIDAGLNTWFAMRFGTREMNWLHAAFGIGMTLASLVAAVLLGNGISWRVGYLLAALVMLGLTLAVVATRPYWNIAPRVIEDAPKDSQRPSLSSTLRIPAVWFLIALFFLGGGAEMTTGTWATSLFSEERGIPIDQAALWVSFYWLTFTIGRIVYGIFNLEGIVTIVLRASMILFAAGAALWGWAPYPWVGFLGLAMIGFGTAPLIPLLTHETPLRVGRSHAENSIGPQYSGAGLGIATLPWLAGIWAAQASLEVVPWMVVAIALGMMVLFELLLQNARRIAAKR